MKKIISIIFPLILLFGATPALAVKVVPPGTPDSAPPLQPRPADIAPNLSGNVDTMRVPAEEPPLPIASSPSSISPETSPQDRTTDLAVSPVPGKSATDLPSKRNLVLPIIIVLVFAGIGVAVWYNNRSIEKS